MATIRPRIKREPGYNRNEDIKKWKRKTTRVYSLSINKLTNPRLIEWLENHQPYQDALRQLICDQINREEIVKAESRKEFLRRRKEFLKKGSNL